MPTPAFAFLWVLGFVTAIDWTTEPGRVVVDFDGKFFLAFALLLAIADSVGRGKE